MDASSKLRGVPSGIIGTKLLPPSPRFEEVPRPMLLNQLDAGSARKLTLIGAPAGYGKTTLLNQWRRAEESNRPFAWVSLDKQDNDPIRLWKHILEALRRVAPGERVGADALAGPGTVATDLVETTLPMLINDLAELPYRIVLVLDDYHLITNGECHETVGFFIEHPPRRSIWSSRPAPTRLSALDACARGVKSTSCAPSSWHSRRKRPRPC